MSHCEEILQELAKPGSTLRKLCFGAAFFLLGMMLLLLGFWETLLVAALTAAGVFIGSSSNLKDSLKALINKLFPPANKTVTYTAEDREKVQRALEKSEKAKSEGQS
ncbi:MAG: DUF2273 domain-containing protein [Christensenellales bacterium]